MSPIDLFRPRVRSARAALVGVASLLFSAIGCFAQSGYQTIQGTRVFTNVDQAAGIATFSNACGSQTLTQRELQGGAIPSRIIPCPRGGSTEDSGDESADARALHVKAIRAGREGRWTDASDAYMKAADAYLEAGNRTRKGQFASSPYDILMERDGCLSNIAGEIDLEEHRGGRLGPNESCNKLAPDHPEIRELQAKFDALVRQHDAEAARPKPIPPVEPPPEPAKAPEPPPVATCAVQVGATVTTMCVSPGNDCECLTVGNGCPYPVTIHFNVDGAARSFELEAGATSHEACTTKSGQRVAYGFFTPWAGYPKAYQPRPVQKGGPQASGPRARPKNFAAYSPNSEFGGSLGYGETREDARSEALKLCKKTSTTCANPASTGDLSTVFATVCCREPRVGCATASASSQEEAAQGARNTLSNAHFDHCLAPRFVSAKPQPFGTVGTEP